MNNITEKIESQPFIETKQSRLFDEFVRSCAKYKYIGVCFGNPGVGKTYTAVEYTQPHLIKGYRWREPLTEKIKTDFKKCKGAFLTIPVCNTPKIIKDLVFDLVFKYCDIAQKIENNPERKEGFYWDYCPFLIVDEADRLSFNSLEELRALYDEYKFGLILMGMPGIEKRLSRYAQFYSRIGFVHEFKALGKDEMKFLFEQKWKELGHQFDKQTFIDVEAINEIIKITQGNFRLINRIFDQMQRIKEINNLPNITKELVDATKKCLVIGDFL